MGFSRQEYWSGSPFPSPGNRPHPGMEPAPPALAGGFFTTSTTWEAPNNDKCHTEVSLHFFRGDIKMLFLGLWVGTFKGGLLQLTKMKGFILDKRAERRLGENTGHQGKNPQCSWYILQIIQTWFTHCHQSYIENEGSHCAEVLLLGIRNPRCLQQGKQQLFSARLALGIQESIWLLSKSILRKKWGGGGGKRDPGFGHSLFYTCFI